MTPHTTSMKGLPVGLVPDLGSWWAALSGLISAHGPAYSAIAIALLAAGTAVSRLLRAWRHRLLVTDSRVVEVFPPPSVDLAGGQVLWDQLAGLLAPAWRRLLLGQPHLAFEYVMTAAGLRLQLWIPGQVPIGLVEHALAAAWPGTTTRTRPAASLTTRPPGASTPTRTRGVTFRLGRDEVFPLRSEFDADPLRSVLSAASGLAPGEQVVVQICARPVTGRRLMRAHSRALALRTGTSGSGLKAAVFDALTPGTRRPTRARGGPLPPYASEDIRVILAKAHHHRYATALRIAVTATDTPEAAGRLRGRLHALAAAYAVHAGPNHLRRARLHRAAETVDARRLGRGILLSVPELAALAHLPADEAVPGLQRAGARNAAPSPATPTGDGEHSRVIGDADAGPAREIAMTVPDTRHHVHVLGKTGSGKSTLLGNLVLADAEAARAAVVIDPRGDLVTDLLSRLPTAAAPRVVLFDPDDNAPPPRLNILQTTDPHATTDLVVGIFSRIFQQWWGPRTDDVLRAALLTLTQLHDPAVTLGDVPRLLGEDAYRHRITRGVTDPVLRQFWDYYNALTPAGRGAVTGPVLNKLRSALLRPWVRQVIASGPSTIDLPHLLDTGGLVLLRLPKGALGEDTASLLGSIMLAATWQATTARSRIPEHQRADASLCVDECHNFLTLPGSMSDMLAEARGYRLSLVLAHQHLAQLPATLREAVDANARTKLLFTCSPEDAHTLQRHTLPDLASHDLSHLGAYQASARLFVSGRELPACTLRTRPLPPPVRGRATAIRKAARAHAAPAPRHAPAGPDRQDPGDADPRAA